MYTYVYHHLNYIHYLHIISFNISIILTYNIPYPHQFFFTQKWQWVKTYISLEAPLKIHQQHMVGG